ncbi:MAG: 3-deoxy-D-manno-octulosonic acid transferase [Geobacteraceae bacterium]|nr:3-deoxy-D-manno-octulosonic acid transferase [Geobacteraceae bacterium]
MARYCQRLAYPIYNILLWVLLPLILIYHTYRAYKRGRPAALLQRFGFDTAALTSLLGGRRPILVHAVSVGESIAVKPLLTALRKCYPDVPLVISNMTETGREISSKISDITAAVYFPFDYTFACSNLLDAMNPRLIIIAETEIWPNFAREANRRSIPLMMVNGRISDRSFGRYLKMSWFFTPVLARFTSLCMQTEVDSERIIAIGAPAEKVHVTRNLKYDIQPRRIKSAERNELCGEYGIDAACQLFVAASTHPGEEEPVIRAFKIILQTSPKSVMVLVPRHPERGAEITALLAAGNLSFRQLSKSRGDGATGAGEVLLADTIGELMKFYAAADVVFVGGSLVTLGGHNLLEPASLGKPVLFGEYMSNFREISALVLQGGAGILVKSSDDLAKAVTELFADPVKTAELGENGIKLLESSAGATELNMAVVVTIQG